MHICSENKTERSYIPALERWTLYKYIWINHWQSYLRTCKNKPSSGKVFEVKKLLKCGNSLNYNPHVHLVGTRELVNTESGEILKTNFISYKSFRFAWMNAVCKHLVREKILTKDDVQQIKQRYKNGFHVYFQPIKGDSNEELFRTSEYIATGFFHNSQILKVDHDSKKVTFRYKSWVDRNTGKKSLGKS